MSTWRFGFGSNMSVANMAQKKNLTVLNHAPGMLRGWRLAYFAAIACVEPGFAMVEEAGEEDEVHGLCFEIPVDQARRLDEQESGYDVVEADVQLYSGEVKQAGFYKTKTAKSDPNILPSKRYALLLARGAKEAGLKDWYVAKLGQAFYVTPPEVRAAALEAFAGNDTTMTAEQVAADKNLVSVLGYVVRLENPPFGSWGGHVIDRRNLVHFRGFSVDTSDIRWGEEGFLPIPRAETEDELEYVWQNLDALIHRGGVVVAKLSEY